MKTKSLSAIEQKLKRKKLAAQRLGDNVLLAGRLDGMLGAIDLATREQRVDQSHELAGGKHQGTFVFMFWDLPVFGLIEGAVSGVVYPQRVSGFDEVIAQVAVGASKHSPIF